MGATMINRSDWPIAKITTPPAKMNLPWLYAVLVLVINTSVNRKRCSHASVSTALSPMGRDHLPDRSGRSFRVDGETYLVALDTARPSNAGIVLKGG
jgi:hypothetical protein